MRVGRMLMNTILFCYAGVVVPFGGDEGGRERYLGVVVRASEWEGGKKAWAELASVVVVEGWRRMGGLRDVLGKVD